MSAWTLSPKPACFTALVAKAAVVGMLALVAGCAAEESEGNKGAEGKGVYRITCVPYRVYRITQPDT